MTTTETGRPRRTPPIDSDTVAAPPRRGRIGVVVTASLATGAVAVPAIVAGPGAAATERAFTGMAMLSLAAGWALLAVVSMRRTDQPQRWAAVPAALIALSGAGVLAVVPTGGTLDWAWPPAAAALAAWIVVQARRHLRSRSRALVVYPVCGMLALGASGGLYETVQEATDDTAEAMPGRLVDVGGHRLHLDCIGNGRPTVVLEPGLGEPSTALARISHGVAATTRVCVYDRAGRGWSDASAAAQDGEEIATDLRILLDRAGEAGPFVLAGHSAGGLYALTFARLFPEQVAGVALLDSMHPEQYTRVPSWPAFHSFLRRATTVLPTAARVGLARVVARSGGQRLPEPERTWHRSFWATPRHYRSLRDEFSTLRTSMSQAGRLTSLGDRPLEVVTALRDAADGWAAAQDDLTGLSTNVEHRVLPDASHGSLVEDDGGAAGATDAVVAVVRAVRGDPGSVLRTGPSGPVR